MKKSIAYYFVFFITIVILLRQLFNCFVFACSVFENFYIILFIFTVIGFIIPYLSYLLTKWANIEKKSKKILSIIYSLLLLVIMFFYALVGICLYVYCSQSAIKPSKILYSRYLKKMAPDYPYMVKHFPADIPKNAKDYYFLIGESDFHGDQISYLRFVADKNYIQSTIEKNKNNIYEKLKFKTAGENYRYINNEFGVKEEDKNNAWVYILKNENNDTHYTSGFITTENNQIIFFFSNFPLKW